MSRTKSQLRVIVAAAGLLILAGLSIAATISTSGVQELRFTLNPGATTTFTLPAKQSPVRIAISETLNNGGTQIPTELMQALVNQDPKSLQFTWIGTNSDGSVTAGTSLSGTTIARIVCGSSSCTIATLSVASTSAGTLEITQNSATTSLPGQYVVKILF